MTTIASTYDCLIAALASGDESAWLPLIDWLIEHRGEDAGAWAKWAWRTGRRPFWCRDRNRDAYHKLAAWFVRASGMLDDPDDLPIVFKPILNEITNENSGAGWCFCDTLADAWRAFFDFAAGIPFEEPI